MALDLERVDQNLQIIRQIEGSWSLPQLPDQVELDLARQRSHGPGGPPAAAHRPREGRPASSAAQRFADPGHARCRRAAEHAADRPGPPRGWRCRGAGNHLGRGRVEGADCVARSPGRTGRAAHVWSERVRGLVATGVNETDATAAVSEGTRVGSGRSTGRSSRGRIWVILQTTTAFMVTAMTPKASQGAPTSA